MPNALVHIGINGLTTGTLLSKADIKWIYIGAILPDVPWIIQRILKIFPDINFYDLRAYAMVQASLLFCLVLSAALSSFSRSYFKTFLILASGSLIHLLSDALEVKWANGVHLFAPFSWELVNIGLFWPESIIISLLSAAGIVYFIFNWKRSTELPLELEYKNARRLSISLLLLILYFILPVTLSVNPYEADNHFIKTLSSKNRTGCYLEIDRRDFRIEAGNKVIETFAGEELKIRNIDLNYPGVISVKGNFTDHTTLEITEYHEHNSAVRDGASYLGLLLIGAVWVQSFRRIK